MAITHPKLTPDKMKALKTLARKIDAEESGSIKVRGREAFARHERLVAIVKELKQERERQGMTLAQAALRTGIAKPNLSRLENSTRITPKLDTLCRYAEALGKTIDVRLVAVGSR